MADDDAIESLKRDREMLYGRLKIENDELDRLNAARSTAEEDKQRARLANANRTEIRREIGVIEVNLAEKQITKVVTDLAPGAKVEWDRDKVPAYVRMRATDTATGATLISSSGDVHVSEIVDKSDDQLRQLLKAWSGGKL
jgi:hypothetical protein